MNPFKRALPWDRAIAVVAVTTAAGMLGFACGGGSEAAPPPQAAVQRDGRPTGLVGEVQSRCDY